MRFECKFVLIVICCIGLLVAMTESVYAEDGIQDCEHEWVRFFAFEEIERTIEQGDESIHWLVQSYPADVCKHCGQYGDVWLGSKDSQPHAYELVEWSRAESGIAMLLQCHLCGFQKEWVVKHETVLNGEAAPCLHGGQCARGDRGYLTEQGKIVPWTDSIEERVNLVALIYNPETQEFRPASRHYCTICGRPGYDKSIVPKSLFAENWNGFPIMTEEYFLTVDMPENLPYQLIDQLRQEAGAA